MAIAEREKLITEAELMAFGSETRVEIIDGAVIEMSPNGMLHLFVGGNIYDVLKPFVVSNGLGYVFSDGLLCILDSSQRGIKGAQVPDVCFIRKGRIPADFDLSRPFPSAPDLAVEVVSPGDDGNILLKRVRKYLEFGTEQVWVILLRRTRGSPVPARQRYHSGLQKRRADGCRGAVSWFSADAGSDFQAAGVGVVSK